MIRSLADGILTIRLDGSPVLMGGYSMQSRRHHFPLAPVCPYSGADDVVEVELPSAGHLWAWTAVTVAPPGYRGEVPYGFGVVQLDDVRLRIVTRLTQADPALLATGDRMHLVAETVYTEDGDDHVIWAFAPGDSTGDRE